MAGVPWVDDAFVPFVIRALPSRIFLTPTEARFLLLREAIHVTSTFVDTVT